VLNPTVLVEVLSESTEAYDRGAKFAHYRTIATLRTYVMVNQREVRVERYDRMEDGDWRLHESVGLEAQLVLPELGVVVPLSEIYEALPVE
jgi:Uma2 family endonuclease